MDLIQQLKWRYATKVYDPTKKLSAEQVASLKEVLQLSPSSFGLQPYKFVQVTNPELRAKLREVSWGQAQVTDASDLFVLCRIEKMDAAYVDKFIALTAKTQGADIANYDGLKGMIMGFVNSQTPETFAPWAEKQAYIALGNLLTSCAVMGVDATPMEGFDRAKYDEILGLPAMGLHAVVICPVGIRGDDKYATAAKVRFPQEELFVTL